MAYNNTILSHESKIHGKVDFPYAVYMGRIPDFLKSFPIHWHEEFEIIVVMDGEVRIQVQEETFSAHQMDIVLIPPGTLHSINQSGTKSAFYFNILFKFSLIEPDEESRIFRKYIKPLLQENAIVNYVPSNTELNDELFPILNQLIIDRAKKYENQELVIKAELFYVLEKLQFALKNEDFNSEAQKKPIQITRLKPLLKKITENPDKAISVEAAADLCAMSQTYFMKFFKKMTGLTFIQYVNQIRLDKAQFLLKTTELSVLQAAEASGFNNFSYFIRTFKEHFGKTPGQWKASYDKNNLYNAIK